MMEFLNVSPRGRSLRFLMINKLGCTYGEVENRSLGLPDVPHFIMPAVPFKATTLDAENMPVAATQGSVFSSSCSTRLIFYICLSSFSCLLADLAVSSADASRAAQKKEI